MRDAATATSEDETAAVTAGPATVSDDESTVRARVESTLDGERFVAAFRRRTDGSPSDPSVDRMRFDALDRLPDDPFDTTPVRTELVVYSETYVYRWVVTGGTVERTTLPRDPAGMPRDR